MQLRIAALVSAAGICASVAHAQVIDATDCRSEADRLKREARDLADAADALRSDDDERGAREVRGKVEDVRGRISRAAKACGAHSQLPVVIASIRQYLLLRHQDVPETRARLKAVDDALVSLAQVHVRVQPADYRMTYAMAETVFTSLGQ